MFHHIWRLSEGGADNLGLACTDEGLVLGRTPLIERRDGRFVVRDEIEIRRLLSCAYGKDIAAERIMDGLAIVAPAMNASDPALARIAAVHLRIPELRDEVARDAMEAEDRLIKYAPGEGAGLHPRNIRKASPDDPKHPGWPAGTGWTGSAISAQGRNARGHRPKSQGPHQTPCGTACTAHSRTPAASLSKQRGSRHRPDCR
jgi:hypothetical protein